MHRKQTAPEAKVAGTVERQGRILTFRITLDSSTAHSRNLGFRRVFLNRRLSALVSEFSGDCESSYNRFGEIYRAETLSRVEIVLH